MADLPKKETLTPAEILCIPVAAASYISAFRYWLQTDFPTFFVLFGTAAVIAVFILLQLHISKPDRSAGRMILLSLLFIFICASPGTLCFSGGHISNILMATSLFLSSRLSQSGRSDTAACISALIAAASFSTPPLIWILPVFMVHAIIRTQKAKSIVPAVTAGAAIAFITEGCIIFLVEDTEILVRSAENYLSGIAGISFGRLNFDGWRTIGHVVFIAVTITAIIRCIFYRIRASKAESEIINSTIILICSTLALSYLYDSGLNGKNLILVSSSISAFLLTILSSVDGEKRFTGILMYIVAVTASCAVAAEFFPTMNDVFSYLCNITKLWR